MPPTESVSAEFIGPCFRQSLVRYFTRGVQKFGNFWKMTSGVQLGSTVDTHSRVSLRSLRQSLVRRLPPGVQEILVVWRDEFDAHAWSLKWINAHASVYGGVISQVFFHVKVDLGSRGRSRVLFTPGQSGHCFPRARVSGSHASDYGGSRKSSCIFNVKVDWEW